MGRIRGIAVALALLGVGCGIEPPDEVMLETYAWAQTINDARWSQGPDHQCPVVGDSFVCFEEADLVENPTDALLMSNPANWQRVHDDIWIFIPIQSALSVP